MDTKIDKDLIGVYDAFYHGKASFKEYSAACDDIAKRLEYTLNNELRAVLLNKKVNPNREEYTGQQYDGNDY